MQTYYSNNRIEDGFMPVSSMVCMKEDFAYCRREGIDELIDDIRLNGSKCVFDNALVNIKNTRMYYLPSTSEYSEELFERECEKEIERLTEIIGRYKKLNFIDCGVGIGSLSESMLKECDLIVFNIEQGLHSIPKRIFENKELMEKCVFLIGRYDDESRYNIRTIRRKYHIDEECISAIPYNIHFKDSICEGKLVDFFNRHINCGKDSEQYKFISWVDNASNIILRKVGMRDR